MDAVDTKKEMLRSGSSIAMFAAEGVHQETGHEVTKEDMYDAYADYCAKSGIASETIKMLGSKLGIYLNYMSEGTSQAYGKKVRVWRNVSTVTPEDKSLDASWDGV